MSHNDGSWALASLQMRLANILFAKRFLLVPISKHRDTFRMDWHFLGRKKSRFRGILGGLHPHMAALCWRFGMDPSSRISIAPYASRPANTSLLQHLPVPQKEPSLRTPACKQHPSAQPRQEVATRWHYGCVLLNH